MAPGRKRDACHITICWNFEEPRVLKIYRDIDGTVRAGQPQDTLPGRVIWMDLIDPDEKEIAFVQHRAKVRVPTKEALSEIEASIAPPDVRTYTSYHASPPSANPTPFASARKPGKDVATFAQSSMRISPDATSPATAKLIATR